MLSFNESSFQDITEPKTRQAFSAYPPGASCSINCIYLLVNVSLTHPLLSCVQCYKMWWWINSYAKRTVWVLQFYIIIACCEDIYMYSFYYGCTSKKVTMITSIHSLPLHFIVLKIRKVLHFLLSRMNKVDHDFLNWQILSLVCPLRNHVIKLLFLFHLSPSY